LVPDVPEEVTGGSELATAESGCAPGRPALEALVMERILTHLVLQAWERPGGSVCQHRSADARSRGFCGAVRL